MNIILYFTYTKQQLTEAIRFNIMPVPWAKYLLAFFTVVILCVTIFFWMNPVKYALPFYYTISKFLLLTLSIIWILTLGFVALGYYFIPDYTFRKNPSVQGNFKVFLNNEGLNYEQEIINADEKSIKTASTPWHSFIKKAENEEFIFLFQSRVKQYILPKSAFVNKSELEEFRIFLNSQPNIITKKFNRQKLWAN